MDDLHLKLCVLQALTADTAIDATHIDVHVDAGEVELIGHVRDYVQMHLAALTARRVEGVKRLNQQLEVRL
ncbi:BON domain-containing protein [Hydrocarboniphaga sp.]|uniref:BON domain-containing protein n=1 Tax=Hydrocarboniphaga sp. TaxID=2033016 RepID=UPI003D0A2DAB